MKDHSAVPLTVEPALVPARRRRRLQAGRHVTPYLLLIPALVVIGGVRGYPLYRRVTLVFESGRIVRVFYPVFPSDRNAQEVVTWLQGRE